MVSLDYTAIMMRMVELDLNQKELAKRMGVTPAFICSIMRQRRPNSRIATASKFAKALNISLTDILKTV